MRHVPIAEFKDKLSELVSAVEAGEEIVVTRHGREVAKLVAMEQDRRVKTSAAVLDLLALREQLRAEGVRVSSDEWIEWKNEGRR